MNKLGGIYFKVGKLLSIGKWLGKGWEKLGERLGKVGKLFPHDKYKMICLELDAVAEEHQQHLDELLNADLEVIDKKTCLEIIKLLN